MYRTLPKAVERADFFRYLVILRHGGMYADSDVECMMPIEDWKDVRAPFPSFLVSFLSFPPPLSRRRRSIALWLTVALEWGVLRVDGHLAIWVRSRAASRARGVGYA